MRQAVFQAGIKDASIRDHLELRAGRLNSFDKMATEVSTVARTRNENDIMPMDVSVLQGKGGKGKNGKSKDGKNKDGKGMAKVKRRLGQLIPSRMPTTTRSVSIVTRSAT